jgi:hypothetical protein
MKIRDMAMMSSAIALCLFASHQARAAGCENLTSLTLNNATVTAATSVPAGTFTPPAAPGQTTPPTPIANLPAFCRVQVTSTPTTDSSIGIEVWVPANWNGKYLQVGNGGFAGAVPYSALGTAIQRGYAAAGTDDGHSDPVNTDASWALNHPQKIIDFGYRSTHLTAVAAKEVIQAFYGDRPKYSYFEGCSQGGQEALMEAQRFPDDYDGIVSGDPDYAAKVLQSLRDAGAGLALDDFGTGYSSLSYLTRLPFDTLKIDRYFVRTMDTNEGSDKIVRSIVNLGRDLDLEVVAEGVENEGMARRLLQIGCDYGQGFGYAPALSPQEAEVYLNESYADGAAPVKRRG